MATKPWNVVLIMSDQHRRDAAGCYGHPMLQTPNLDRLAREGTRFTQAYAASPICGPCRSAVITGRQVHRCGALSHKLIREPMHYPTLGDVFRQAGYATAAFGKVHAAGENDDRDLGFDERALRIYTPTANDYQHTIGLDKFWQYCSYLPQYKPSEGAQSRNNYNPANEPIALEEELILDHMVAQRSNEFMSRKAADDQPFCLWVGFEKPHTEWYAPARFHAMYNPDDIALPDDIWESHDHLPDTIRANPRFPKVTRDAYTDHQLRCCVAAYYANVTYMDEQLGKVLDHIDALGIADNTLVIYASDHGENLFNHRLVHKHCFYETAVGVPLLVRAPGRVAADAVSDELVSLIDLLPTATDCCGIDAPQGVDGGSLLPLCDASAMPGERQRREVFSEFYEWGVAERMIRTDRWKYVYSHGHTPQLYDLASDPGEHVNLALEPTYAQTCRELEARLKADWTMPDLPGLERATA